MQKNISTALACLVHSMMVISIAGYFFLKFVSKPTAGSRSPDNIVAFKRQQDSRCNNYTRSLQPTHYRNPPSILNLRPLHFHRPAAVKSRGF
ncbi:Fc receptor-like protein [Trichinella spiralis]|uniref:Fc receptor-like protein n=1 Tax=Trichinella spiralis TaxID=6334 RepID=A0ABR3K464_TRISP